MVWSELAQREIDIPDFHQLSNWIPPFVLISSTTVIATLLTLLRKYVQKLTLEYAEREKIPQTKKFSESAWKAAFYLIAWMWGVYEICTCTWFPDTMNCWRDWPNVPPMKTTLLMYYVFQLGFYWHSLFAHFTMEVERADYWPLLGHHIVTIILIYASYNLKFYRIGLLVLVSHDTNDVFLETGKLFVYRDNKTMINVTFFLIMLSWIITRLGIFPFMIIRSAIFESIQVIPADIASNFMYYELNVGLLFLLCLHIYWFGLMIRILIRTLKGQDEISDIREEEKDSKKEE